MRQHIVEHDGATRRSNTRGRANYNGVENNSKLTKSSMKKL